MHNARSLSFVAVCLLATAICAEASISANYTVAIPLNITGGGDMSVQAFSKSPFAFVLAANGANSSLTAFNYKSASLLSSIPINCSGAGRLVGVERSSLLVVFCNAELHVAYFANDILSPLATIPNTPFRYTRYTVSEDSTKIYFLVGTDSSCAVTVTALDLTEFTVNPISVYNASADYYYVTGCAMGTVSPNGQFLSIEQDFVTDGDGAGMEVASYNISTWDRNEYPFVFFDNPNEDPSYYNFSPDLLIPAPLNASQYLGFIRRDVVPIGFHPYQVYLTPVLLPSGLGWPGVSAPIISSIQQSSMLTTSHEDGCYYLSGYTDVDTGGFDTTTEQYALLPTPRLVGTVALPCASQLCGIAATANHLFNVDGGNLYVYDVVCK